MFLVGTLIKQLRPKQTDQKGAANNQKEMQNDFKETQNYKEEAQNDHKEKQSNYTDTKHIKWQKKKCKMSPETQNANRDKKITAKYQKNSYKKGRQRDFCVCVSWCVLSPVCSAVFKTFCQHCLTEAMKCKRERKESSSSYLAYFGT